MEGARGVPRGCPEALVLGGVADEKLGSLLGEGRPWGWVEPPP